jgi:hypothetical protein
VEAEDAVLAESGEAAVLRIALVIGRGFGPRTSATEAVAAALAAGRRPRLFHDQYRTPIDPASIADVVARVLDRKASGRFHIGGAERLSRFELGQRVARVLGLPADLEGISSAEQAVPRPGEASLDSSRARRELGWEPRPLDDAIRDGRRPHRIIAASRWIRRRWPITCGARRATSRRACRRSGCSRSARPWPRSWCARTRRRRPAIPISIPTSSPWPTARPG